MKNIILINAKIKREYKEWLEKAKGLSITTVDQMLRPIVLYESIFNNEDFGHFRKQKALEFISYLRMKQNGNKLSSNSIRTYLMHLKSFFEWLITQPGYKSKIHSSDLEYLRVSKKESRLAAQKTIRKYPSKQDIIDLVNSVEIKNDVDRRDQAIIAFSFLTGMRDSAIISLRLNCIDIERLWVEQNPRFGVNTKGSKIIFSKIFKFDKDLFDVVIRWVNYLKKKGYTDVDPVFPRCKNEFIDDGYSFQESTEIEPCFWSSSNSIRKIFKERSEKAHLPYFPPHAFRHSAVEYALGLARNGMEVKAISQNFGHEDVSTTISVYANLPLDQLMNLLDDMELGKKSITLNEESIKMLTEMHKIVVTKKNG